MSFHFDELKIVVIGHDPCPGNLASAQSRVVSALGGDEDAVGDILEAIEEHGVVKTLLGQVAQMKASDETFDAKVTVVIESVEHHVGEEEEEMFPDAETTLGKKTLDELGVRIEQRKGELGAGR